MMFGRYFSALLAISVVVSLSAQSPRAQKRMKVLERTYGKKEFKTISKAKSKTLKKKKSNVRVIRETPRAEGLIISKAESNEISKRYTVWKAETERLEKLEKSGSKEARYELRRRREIRVHLIRVAKIKSLHAYAKKSRNKGLLGTVKRLIAEENERFEKAMLEIQSHKGHDH